LLDYGEIHGPINPCESRSMDISNALARHLLDAAPDPNLVIDRDGYI
jgi:hypothetical protein